MYNQDPFMQQPVASPFQPAPDTEVLEDENFSYQ